MQNVSRPCRRPRPEGWIGQLPEIIKGPLVGSKINLRHVGFKRPDQHGVEDTEGDAGPQAKRAVDAFTFCWVWWLSRNVTGCRVCHGNCPVNK